MNNFKISDNFNVVSLPNGLTIIKKQYEPLLIKEIIPFIGEFPVSKTSQITGGRKGLYRFKLESAELHTVVVRPCMRGGFIGPLLKDIYWSKKRLISELIISEMALNKGLLVPEIIGIVLQPKGFGFYKGFVIMREIYNSLNLYDYIKTVVIHDKNTLIDRKKELMEAVLESLSMFHNEGFYHSDLNMTNLIVQKESDGKSKVWIIDLDRAGYYEKLTMNQRISNLVRLIRSLIKLGLSSIITRGDRLKFLKRYLEFIGENNRYQIKKINYSCSSNINCHRVWWKLTRTR